jgi:hypothetical protein
MMLRAAFFRFGVPAVLVLGAALGGGWKWERFLP